MANVSTYTPTTWEDSPSKKTPITAANLNKMETGISNNRKEIIQLEDSFISDSELTTLWSQATS